MKLRNKKTGCVGDFGIKSIKDGGEFIRVMDSNAPPSKIKIECGTLYYYDTLAELCEEWEDYAPKEPLIKDERIRKVVRLCADIWGANKILAIKSGSRIEFSDGTPNMRYVSFMYAEWQDEIKDRTYYTIEELCGEEEE